MQELYLDNPKITKEELIKAVREEVDGVELWISRDDSGYMINLLEPHLISRYNTNKKLFSIEEGGEVFGDLDYDYFNLELYTKIKKRAIECISMYRVLKDRKKAEKIMQQINNLAQDLLTVSSFQA